MKRLASLLCLFTALGLLSPSYAMAAAWPDSSIGAGLGVQVKPERTDDAQLTRIHDLGFTYLRYDMRWVEVEGQRGHYDWSRFDSFISRMRAHHLKAIIILNGGNPAYSGMVAVPPEKAFGNSAAPRAPTSDEDVQAFTDFAVAAVKRYGIADIIWEIWNEPDNLAFWPPKPDAAAYARLASKTCDAMRSAAPDAAIIAPGTAGLPVYGGSEFLAPLLQSPASRCLTALSIHPYRLKQPPETVMDDYATKVKPFIASETPVGQKPLAFISGEWGYPSNQIAQDQQADYMLRMFLANRLSGVPLSIWYEWKDSRPGPAPDDMEAHFGVVDYTGNDKVAATAISDLLPKIKDAVIEKRLPAPNVNCFIVRIRQPDGSHQLLAWNANQQMGGDSQLVTGSKAAAHIYPLTARPQLFDDAADGQAACR